MSHELLQILAMVLSYYCFIRNQKRGSSSGASVQDVLRVVCAFVITFVNDLMLLPDATPNYDLTVEVMC